MINRIGEPFIELPSVDSTNIYAMQQAHARLAIPGTVYFAYEQTGGKGQRAKSWQTEKGKNLVMSAVIKPPLIEIEQLFLLSAATALACCQFYKSFCGDETAIKWPNDIYWNDRKAGGILIENVIRGRSWEYAIIGIGMNINQTAFDKSLPNPVSLKQITGKNFNIIKIAKELCGVLDFYMERLITGDGKGILNDYNDVLYKKGQEVILNIAEQEVKGVLTGVNEKGELIFSSQEEKLIAFGEAEWIITKMKKS